MNMCEKEKTSINELILACYFELIVKMTKALSNGKSQKSSPQCYWGIFRIFNFQVNYILYWQFHFGNKIPLSYLFTKWQWTYILDFGPWSFGEVHSIWVCGLERPSRMHGQFFFWSRAEWTTYFGRVKKKRLNESAQGLHVMGPSLILLEDPFLTKLIGGALTSSVSLRQGIMIFMITLEP